MLSSSTLNAALILLIGALIIVISAGLVLLIARLRRDPRIIAANPGVGAVADALTHYIYQGIFAGERLALLGLQDFSATLDGVDRHKIASAVYDSLPETLVVAGVALPISLIKQMISRDQFETLVEDTYRATKAFFVREQDYLKSQVTTFNKTQVQASTPSAA